MVLPASLSPILYKALENTRKNGTQTVFAAFVLNLDLRTLRLYQVGDVEAILQYKVKVPERVRAASKGRWSSAGLCDLRLRVSDRVEVSGLVIRSDGIGDLLGASSIGKRSINKNSFAQLASDLAGTDDLSFIAVSFEAESPIDDKQVHTLSHTHKSGGHPGQCSFATFLKQCSLLPSTPRERFRNSNH